MPLTSVLIATINDPLVAKTVENIRAAADQDTEFIIINDGGEQPSIPDTRMIHHRQTLGRRVSFNEAARIAQGSYLLIIDPHCSMSEGWDITMTAAADHRNLAFALIRDMDPETYEQHHGFHGLVSMNRKWTEKWWNRKKVEDCLPVEESMCFTGCGWVIHRDRFWELGGYDERLGKYGWDGPEWSCKVWLSDNSGKVLLCTDVVCGHVFGTNASGKLYRCEMIPQKQYTDYMEKHWGDRVHTLVERFAPVPDWHDTKEKAMDSVGTVREVKLSRQRESVTKDDKGQVIRKAIEYFEYVYKDDGNGPDEETIKAAYQDKLVKVGEDVWELQDGQLTKVA